MKILGPVEKNEHNLYYHLTDYHGYSHSINTNKLESLRHSGVSLTYNPNLNNILGRMHADFKFVLSNNVLDEFPANHFVHSVQEVGTSGRRRTKDLAEFEIRTEAKCLMRY